MWQRFTERARKVVFYAQEEAQKFGEGYVSTEHLLLGLCRESDSTAARALEQMGVNLMRIPAEVEKQLPKGDARPSQDMTLTPRAKRVIDLAYDESLNLNNNYIGTEHLLLGLVREGDGLAGRVLAKLGVDLEPTRRTVVSLQDSGAEYVPSPPRPERPVRPQHYNPTAYFHIRQGRFIPEHLFLLLMADAACDASLAGDQAVPEIDNLVLRVEAELIGGAATSSSEPASVVLARILATASTTAKDMDLDFPRPRHILLALLDEPESLIATLLGPYRVALTEAVKEYRE